MINIQFFIIPFLLWIGLIVKYKTFSGKSSLSEKIQVGLLSFILISNGAMTYQLLIHAILHFNIFLKANFYSVWFIDPLIVFAVKMIAIGVNIFTLTAGVRLLKQNKEILNISLFFAPIFMLVNSAVVILSACKIITDTSIRGKVIAVFVLFNLGFSIWLFLFALKKRTKWENQKI